MLFVLEFIVPVFLIGIWLRTTLQCMKGNSKWRKIFATVVTAICFVGIAIIIFYYFYGGEEYAISYLFLYTLMAFVLFIVHIFFTKRFIGILGCVGSFFAIFLLICFAFYSDLGVAKRKCTFQSHDDIVSILNIENLPQCHFNRAWNSSRDAGNRRIQFDYDNLDSIQIADFIATLEKRYPMQCTRKDDYNDVLMKYSTVFNDTVFGMQYANIRFVDRGFYLAYGGCWIDPESFQKWLSDSLNCTIPSCNMLTYEISQYGPDYTWEALFKFDKPVSEKVITQLRRACKGKKNWLFSKENKSYGIVYQANNNNYVEYSKGVCFEKDEEGNITYAKVSFIDY